MSNMKCPHCDSVYYVCKDCGCITSKPVLFKMGKAYNGKTLMQRYGCKNCRRTTTKPVIEQIETGK